MKTLADVFVHTLQDVYFADEPTLTTGRRPEGPCD
jgi:ferritin-like metal-binding protein YciE